MKFSPSPVLTPEDLGVRFEEDSPDLTEEEAAEAVDTIGLADFATRVKAFAAEAGYPGVLKYELRRRAGILFSRVSYTDGPQRLFRVEWLRRRA